MGGSPRVVIEVFGDRAYVPARLGRALAPLLNYDTRDFAPNAAGVLRARRVEGSVARREGDRLSFPVSMAIAAERCLERQGYDVALTGHVRGLRGRAAADPAVLASLSSVERALADACLHYHRG
jgi:hypothetical protein